jgi:zinc-ribbon domain
MYCPNCGANNQAEVKFCTRCGTNLGVVSDALTGKIAETTAVDDRVATLLKDYYEGRRGTITGAVLIPAGVLIMAILVAAGMHAIGAFFIICWMFFWGAAELAGGLGKWIASSGELKALGYGSRSQIQGAHAQNLPAVYQAELPPAGYSTGPVDAPGSVTEHTTRQLDERGYRAPSPHGEDQRSR